MPNTYRRKYDNAEARVRVTGDGRYAKYIADTAYTFKAFNTRAAADNWLRHLSYKPEVII